MGDPAVATYAFVAFVAGDRASRLGGWPRRGKKAGFAIILAGVVLGLLTVVAAAGQLAVLLIWLAVVGVGYAGSQLFPLAMLTSPVSMLRSSARTGSPADPAPGGFAFHAAQFASAR